MKNKELWLASRIGILIVFVFLPIMRIHEQLKWKKFNEYIQLCDQSRETNDLAGAEYWLNKAEEEFNKNK